MNTIMIGSAGADVITLQQLLTQMGFYAGPISGTFDEATRMAVVAFQTAFGLPADGIVTPAVWVVLKPTTTVSRPVLSYGSTGSYVVELQNILKTLGFYTGAIDGNFGAVTSSAVRQFQTRNGLTADGIVGQSSWNALLNQIPASGGGSGSTGGATSGTTTEYYVKSGDSLWSIAQKYGTTVEAIKLASGITSGALSIGQLLKIPTGTTTPPVSGGGSSAVPYPGYVIKRGQNGTNVAKIQSQLNMLASKYPSIPQVKVDGVFGSATQAQVRAFQRIFGLSQDGMVGPATWNAMFNSSTGGVVTPPPATNTGSRRHTVVYGDSLWKLAQKYGTTVAAIKSANGLTTDSLSIGQILIIPV